MAKARMCDRCGVCFNPLDQGDKDMVRFQNPVFQTSEGLKNCKISRHLIDDAPDAWMDLCPKCTAAFELFMMNCDTFNMPGSFEEEVDQ